MSSNIERSKVTRVKKKVGGEIKPPVEPNYGEPIVDPDISVPSSDPVVPAPAPVPDVPVVEKPGLKTSEFYLTTVLVITSALSVLNLHVDTARIESLATLIVLVAPGVISLVAYIKKRAEVKKEVVQANARLAAARITYQVRSR